jgi:AcrR family transcriptional regulator
MGRPARVTRDQVIAAAREAFASRGYEGTTLAYIAAQVGVSPAALLRHAPSKEALFGLAMSSEKDVPRVPIKFLETMTGTEDPRLVLKRVANAFVPFIEARLGEHIARWQYANVGTPRAIPLLFDPDQRPTPPEKALGELERYLRRASRAGRVHVKDPRSAALSFLGSLQAYIFFHKMLGMDPPLPLRRYVDTVVTIWTHGAIRTPRRTRKRS